MAQPNKALVALVAGMGVVILLGFGALIAGLILKATETEPTSPVAAESGAPVAKAFTSAKTDLRKITLPTGHRIENIGLSGATIVLHTSHSQGPGGVFIIDGDSGDILRRFEIGNSP